MKAVLKEVAFALGLVMVIGTIHLFIGDFLLFQVVAASLTLPLMFIACKLDDVDCWLGGIEGALTGLLLGFALTLPFALISEVKYEGSLTWRPLAIYLLVALWEEAVFRGYPLARGSPYSLLATSLLFSLVHAGNPGFTPLAFLGIFAAALMLGAVRIYRGFLSAAALHFSWNFFEGSFWGFTVSGIRLGSLFRSRINGPALITGGDFGPEASIIATLLFTLVFLLVWRLRNPNFLSD